MDEPDLTDQEIEQKAALPAVDRTVIEAVNLASAPYKIPAKGSEDCHDLNPWVSDAYDSYSCEIFAIMRDQAEKSGDSFRAKSVVWRAKVPSLPF